MAFLRGAEATLSIIQWNGFDAIEKKRNQKTYRNPLLDQRIRNQRNRDEALLLHKAKQASVATPVVYYISPQESRLIMERIEGTRAKEYLQKRKDTALCQKVGEMIGQLHHANLIHGDLTTSNILIRKKEPVLIDFGLAYHSTKLEDFSTDLLGFKKTFFATHAGFEKGWKKVEAGYVKGGGKKEAINHIQKIEERARYS